MYVKWLKQAINENIIAKITSDTGNACTFSPPEGIFHNVKIHVLRASVTMSY